MTAEQGIGFLVFSFVAAITPGPSNVMLTATGAIVGVVRGLPCLAGVCAGMGLLIFSVAAGLGHLMLGHAAILTILNVAGAAFLLWLSWRIAMAPPGGAGAGQEPVGFARAAAFQWVNPKAWMVSSGAASTYLQADAPSPLLQAASFAALFVAAAAPSSLAWLLFGASMQRWLRNPRAARIVHVAMGLSLAASVLLIL